MVPLGKKCNNMNRALDHFCAHTGYIGQGKSPVDGEMSELTLPSRHMIRNSNREDLRPSGRARYILVTDTEFYKCMGKKHFLFANRQTSPEL